MLVLWFLFIYFPFSLCVCMSWVCEHICMCICVCMWRHEVRKHPWSLVHLIPWVRVSQSNPEHLHIHRMPPQLTDLKTKTKTITTKTKQNITKNNRKTLKDHTCSLIDSLVYFSWYQMGVYPSPTDGSMCMWLLWLSSLCSQFILWIFCVCPPRLKLQEDPQAHPAFKWVVGTQTPQSSLLHCSPLTIEPSL